MSVWRSAVIAAASLSLAACGGGGTSSSTPGVVTPPSPLPPPPPPPPPAPPPPPPPSGPQRYSDEVFSQTARQSDVVFGEADRSYGKQTLRMDIYTPVGDGETERPVFILAFPGGFVEGDRRDPDLVDIAESLARRGYVTASIDYRLFEGSPSTPDEIDIAIIEAMHDMRAAVRFLREDALGPDTYGTRPDKIFVGGMSAGGVMASFAGALDARDGVSTAVRDFLDAHNGIAGDSSTNTAISSDIQGVFSISGGITDFLWIDMNTAPIYAAHEEYDPTVPCYYGLGDAGISLAGGCDMVQLAQSFGVQAELYLVAGASTHLEFTPEQTAAYINGASAFFAGLLE